MSITVAGIVWVSPFTPLTDGVTWMGTCVPGAGAGVACPEVAGAEPLIGSRIEGEPPPVPILELDMTARERDVTINRTAEAVVARVRTVAEPRGPNTVWDPMPPKAPAKSAALPLCSSTTMIRNSDTIT